MEIREAGDDSVNMNVVYAFATIVSSFLIFKTDGWMGMLIAFVACLIVMPIVIKITAIARMYTKPDRIITSGFVDTFKTKFFWSYGIFMTTILASLFSVYVLLPNSSNASTNDTETIMATELNPVIDEVEPPAPAEDQKPSGGGSYENFAADQRTASQELSQGPKGKAVSERPEISVVGGAPQDPDAKCRDAEGNWICE